MAILWISGKTSLTRIERPVQETFHKRSRKRPYEAQRYRLVRLHLLWPQHPHRRHRRRSRLRVCLLHPEVHLLRSRPDGKRIHGLRSLPGLPGVRRRQESHHRPPRGRHHRLRGKTQARAAVICHLSLPAPLRQKRCGAYCISASHFMTTVCQF